MAKKMIYAAALAALLVGVHVLSGAPVCSPSRTDVLAGRQNKLPTCSPSRVEILTGRNY